MDVKTRQWLEENECEVKTRRLQDMIPASIVTVYYVSEKDIWVAITITDSEHLWFSLCIICLLPPGKQTTCIIPQ